MLSLRNNQFWARGYIDSGFLTVIIDGDGIATHVGFGNLGDDTGNGSPEDVIIAQLAGGVKLASAAIATHMDGIFAIVDVRIGFRIGGEDGENNLLVLVTGERANDNPIVLAFLIGLEIYPLTLSFISSGIRSSGAILKPSGNINTAPTFKPPCCHRRGFVVGSGRREF